MQLLAVFVFAFLLRLINLNQSLWLDETIVAKVVKTIPFPLIPVQFSPADFHPPLYYLFMSIWTGLIGQSEIALRLPSVISSLIAGWFVYKSASFLKGKSTGFWASALFLFNPLIVYYSQEARMYMMATMFLTGALYYFLRILKKNKSGSRKLMMDIVSFNIFASLALFTFYGSIFFIVGMIIVYVVISTKRSAWRNLQTTFSVTWGLLFSLLLLSPLLLQQFTTAHTGLVDVKNWSMVLGKAELKNVAMLFLKFATGRLSWYPKWSYYLVAGVPTLLTWLVVLGGMKKNRLLAYLFGIPLLLGFLVSFWAPMMMYFRFLYLIPVMSLLIAVTVIPAKAGIHKGLLYRSRIGFGMTMLFFIIFSLAYLLLPQFHREDWKQLSTQLTRGIPVYMIVPSSDPVAYYRNDVTVRELRSIDKSPLPEYIDIIPYTSEIYGLDYEQLLKKKGCIKESQSEFRGPLILERWKCPSSFLGQSHEGAI